MANTPQSTGFSLRRWSRRKLAATRGEPELQSPERVPAQVRVPPVATESKAAPMPAATTPVTAAPAADRAAEPTAPAVALPPLESLTIDSDFSPFMQPGVDADVKRMALRKLLRHPRFNVMDGLDVYIDDYSKPSPVEPELARALMQARRLFDSPDTAVTAEDIVCEVPAEPREAPDDETAADVAASPPPPSEPSSPA